MPGSPRIRLCERCWRPLSTGTVFRVFRHPDPFPVVPDGEAAGRAAESLSFRHLDDDPSCTGVQLAETDAEQPA